MCFSVETDTLGCSGLVCVFILVSVEKCRQVMT